MTVGLSVFQVAGGVRRFTVATVEQGYE